jgi:hypothetical protein
MVIAVLSAVVVVIAVRALFSAIVVILTALAPVVSAAVRDSLPDAHVVYAVSCAAPSFTAVRPCLALLVPASSHEKYSNQQSTENRCCL